MQFGLSLRPQHNDQMTQLIFDLAGIGDGVANLLS